MTSYSGASYPTIITPLPSTAKQRAYAVTFAPEGDGYRSFRNPYADYMDELHEELSKKRTFNPHKLAVIKNEKLRWDRFYSEDDKLVNMYCMMKVTGNLAGLSLPDLTDPDMNIIFNTAYTLIKYFEVRKYSPEIIKNVIEYRVPLYTISFEWIDRFCREVLEIQRVVTEADHQLEIYANNWEFITKMASEFGSLEKVFPLMGWLSDIMYEIVNWYVFDKFSARVFTLEGKVDLSSIPF